MLVHVVLARNLQLVASEKRDTGGSVDGRGKNGQTDSNEIFTGNAKNPIF